MVTPSPLPAVHLDTLIVRATALAGVSHDGALNHRVATALIELLETQERLHLLRFEELTEDERPAFEARMDAITVLLDIADALSAAPGSATRAPS